MSIEPIAELELPADQIRAVRLVAARIALSEGLDDETAEDIKLAVGEACSRLVAVGESSILNVVFQRDEATLTVHFPHFPPPTEPTATAIDAAAEDAADVDFGWLILTAVAPSVGMDGDTWRLAWPLPRAVVPHA